MRLRAYLALLVAVCSATAWGRQIFSAEDRDKIGASWKAVTFDVADSSKGRWQVRATAEGSAWFFAYNKARGIGKSANLQVAPAQNQEQAAWNAWIDARVAYDRAVATERAKLLNQANAESDELSFSNQDLLEQRTAKLKDPGLPPGGLIALVGEPPEFATAVRPRTHVIDFGDDEPITFSDQPNTSPKFAYLRAPHGVISGGRKLGDMSAAEMFAMREAAAVDESAWRVMCAVSGLEGGFDSINTYDTGFVSVGLIQFTAGQAGTGSLARVLSRMKDEDPDEFDEYFRRFGIDVDGDGQLAVLSTDGFEAVGSSAVFEIVDDPSLAAVFVRAGRYCQAFRVAQIRTALASYYPADDKVTVSLNGEKKAIRVGDVVRSEAGMATLMDRKVHTGNLGPLSAVLTKVAESCGSCSADVLAAREAAVVAAMKHRRDFTKMDDLTQPGIALSSRGGNVTSRGWSRKGRKRS